MTRTRHPVFLLPAKIFNALRRQLRDRMNMRRAYRHGSFAPASHGTGIPQTIQRIIATCIFPASAGLDGLCKRYSAHIFDILGSGWLNVRHGMDCPGLDGCKFNMGTAFSADRDGLWLRQFINPSNLEESQRIWKLIGCEYTPIDWQLDFRSGYRWQESKWHTTLSYGTVDGADVKIPWELARMYHLPVLALAYAQNPDKALFTEFRSQCLDFIACNPPGFGINWSCAMEVAIRATNILVAFDIFRAAGVTPDRDFEQTLAASIYSHGCHILDYLEWTPELTRLGNHYLADIAGLVFIAAYLPESAQTNRWLEFAAREFYVQTSNQFNADGSNFEASTAYHRLTSEIAAFTTAILSGLPRERLTAPTPAGHLDAICRMKQFLSAITMTNGRLLQIGDNDSGRFIKLEPASCADGEEHLTTSATLSALTALSAPQTGDITTHASLITLLARGQLTSRTGLSETASEPDFYRDFGLYIYRAGRAHMTLRCGPAGRNGHAGHDHNDQLSFTLSLGNQPVFTDPGSYTYTPLPADRNLFRSTAMHNVPQIAGLEQNQWQEGRSGLFSFHSCCRTNIITAGAREFVGEYEIAGNTVRRAITIVDTALECEDSAGSQQLQVNFQLAPGLNAVCTPEGCTVSAGSLEICRLFTSAPVTIHDSWFSAGYGLKQRTSSLIISGAAAAIKWKITWAK